MKPLCLLTIGLLISVSVRGEPLVFQSGSQRVTVIELFTSQGCSSCPPAEKWFNQFIRNPLLWTRYVPVAFHVHYWNYLGWKDIYSSGVYTRRQYGYKNKGNIGSVYTPGFVVNGKEWKGYFWVKSLPDEEPPVAGILSATLNGKKLRVTYSPPSSITSKINLNIAILGVHLYTDVKAGENEGKKLYQNFVVFTFRRYPSVKNEWQTQLPAVKQTAQKYALALWVNLIENPAPIQATGGWLPANFF